MLSQFMLVLLAHTLEESASLVLAEELKQLLPLGVTHQELDIDVCCTVILLEEFFVLLHGRIFLPLWLRRLCGLLPLGLLLRLEDFSQQLIVSHLVHILIRFEVQIIFMLVHSSS